MLYVLWCVGMLLVEFVLFGWNKLIYIEGVIFKGFNLSVVLLIFEYKINVYLWILVVGRVGLGMSCEYCFFFVCD